MGQRDYGCPYNDRVHPEWRDLHSRALPVAPRSMRCLFDSADRRKHRAHDRPAAEAGDLCTACAASCCRLLGCGTKMVPAS